MNLTILKVMLQSGFKFPERNTSSSPKSLMFSSFHCSFLLRSNYLNIISTVHAPCYLFVTVVCSVRLVGRLNCDGLALGMDQMPRQNIEFQLDLKLGFSCPFNEGVAQAVSLSGKHWGFV